ncbi:G-protein coupled receptor Mth2-like [Pollicipes pollicipes]|uniref:G-protein coupled receptor Mth2-like n=1 Tax=Pollicipes pollicipes TaxID=41117 RepID=UPI001884C85B|nr:G-protein coupled receptor Mth2-like [Pollicipes pollicipes]
MHQASSLLDPETLQPACARHVCARKCCPRGLQIRAADLACVPQRAPWRPVFHTEHTREVKVESFLTMPGNPVCGPSEAGAYGRVFALQPAYDDKDIFYLQRDGTLWVPQQSTSFAPSQFCVDQARYVYNSTFSIDYDYAIACFGKPLASVYTATYVYRFLLVVSALCLLVTFVIYVAIPELQNVHGRCLLSHVAALFTAYVCLLSAQSRTVYANMTFCHVTAIVMYYSFLAVCFWLNAMSFDIWWTFSRVRSTTAASNKTKRFIRYSLYCWLCPLVLTLVTVFMQYAPDDLVPPEDYLRPGLGTVRCWFPGNWEMLAYLHGPILLLMTSNLVLFVLTARSLFRSEQDTQMVRKKKTGVERLKIYVNLFIVMGIAWITEALSTYLGPKYLWYITDVINSLQGFFIFLLFTMRGRTRKIIRRHLDSWGCCRWWRCCGQRQADGRTFALFASSKTRTTSLPTGTSTKRNTIEDAAAARLQAE